MSDVYLTTCIANDIMGNLTGKNLNSNLVSWRLWQFAINILIYYIWKCKFKNRLCMEDYSHKHTPKYPLIQCVHKITQICGKRIITSTPFKKKGSYSYKRMNPYSQTSCNVTLCLHYSNPFLSQWVREE